MPPSKIICVGRNYRDHAAELGHEVPPRPLLFFKPPSSLVGTGEAILLPAASERVDFEGELAIVIGRRCRRVPREEAASVIGGLAAFNDVTARDLQQVDGQWARAKGFDTFAPMGAVAASALDWGDLAIRTMVNGAIRQESRTSMMIFPVELLIATITEIMTLEAGDVIATGTPVGVGPLAPGDLVEVWIEGLEPLRNPVMAEPVRV